MILPDWFICTNVLKLVHTHVTIITYQKQAIGTKNRKGRIDRQEERIDMTEKLTLSVEEAGKLLGVSRQVAYQLIHRADFPTLRIGRRVLVPKKQLEAWMDRMTNTMEGIDHDAG